MMIARQQRGPAGFLATSRWLRSAFADLQFEPEEAAAQPDGTVLAAATMIGRHTGIFQGIAPTGPTFRQPQVHIFRTSNGRLISHRAVRDDLGGLVQLGWRPRERDLARRQTDHERLLAARRPT